MSLHGLTTTVLFKHARLIDGLSDQPLEGVSILVEGERISQVLLGDIDVPQRVGTTPLSGKT
ncbi:MAG: hypothetical protein JKX92_09050 [Porticoccaceae bacterium]|nr:hypothetical protein [Porticoccaceae bacterium]